MVTGYNTVPGQTDDTPCIAASGADICGRHDAAACPRRIKLGTTVEIRGTTYICEDRLAKKYDTRFDISCDKDTVCPSQVTGWTTIKVYDDGEEAPAGVLRPVKAAKAERAGEHHLALLRAVHVLRSAHHLGKRLFASAGGAVVLRGRG